MAKSPGPLDVCLEPDLIERLQGITDLAELEREEKLGLRFVQADRVVTDYLAGTWPEFAELDRSLRRAASRQVGQAVLEECAKTRARLAGVLTVSGELVVDQ